MGWISCSSVVFVLMLFSKLFGLVYVFVYLLLLSFVYASCWFMFVRLVYLSFRSYNRHNTHNNINKQTKTRRTHNTKETQPYIHYFPAGALDIYSRSGPGLGILYFCCVFTLCMFVSRSCYVLCLLLFCCIVCCRLVCVSDCLTTTQHNTLNTDTLDMALFMACVKCSL